MWKAPHVAPEGLGACDQGRGGNSRTLEEPSCAHAISRVCREPAPALCCAGTHPWPSGASLGAGGCSRAPAPRGEAQMTHPRHRCPARGAPHCWRTPPNRGPWPAPGSLLQTGMAHAPQNCVCGLPSRTPEGPGSGRLPRQRVSLVLWTQLRRLQRAPRPPAQSPRQDPAYVWCRLPMRSL